MKLISCKQSCNRSKGIYRDNGLRSTQDTLVRAVAYSTIYISVLNHPCIKYLHNRTIFLCTNDWVTPRSYSDDKFHGGGRINFTVYSFVFLLLLSNNLCGILFNNLCGMWCSMNTPSKNNKKLKNPWAILIISWVYFIENYELHFEDMGYIYVYFSSIISLHYKLILFLLLYQPLFISCHGCTRIIYICMCNRHYYKYFDFINKPAYLEVSFAYPVYKILLFRSIM